MSVKKPRIQFMVSAFAGISLIMLITTTCIENKSEKKANQQSHYVFKKEGTLSFYSKDENSKIIVIDIELAEDYYERARGLMFRRSMSDSIGMLFLMDKEEPQSFWMRNTYISLDIIFVNNDFDIVKIQKCTKPLSDNPVPSIKNAKYVVEVLCGFCDRKNIVEGDKIQFTKLN